MASDLTDDEAVVAAFVAQAKALLAAQSLDEEQFGLLEPVTLEEMIEARKAVGWIADRPLWEDCMA